MAERAPDRPPIRMVDIGSKAVSQREATARVEIRMRPDTLAAIDRGTIAKGDVVAAATIAGIAAAKRTWDLIPLCHQIPLSSVDITFATRGRLGRMTITATARTHAATGAEMEALTAAAVAALTVYDMCKGSDPAIQIAELALVRKSGGQSGTWERAEE